MTNAEEHRRRLEAALHEVGATTADSTALYADLQARYCEPHRHYHTMAHVEACLAWLDWFAFHAERRAEVELALWFHDAVYDPTRSDNEQQSALLAAHWLQTLGVPDDVIGRVESLVLATQDHAASSSDGALLCSIDLAILGAEAPRYAEFERGVQREYGHVPDEAFRAGRAAVLRGFLERPTIYPAGPIAEVLEARARRNLERALTNASSP